MANFPLRLWPRRSAGSTHGKSNCFSNLDASRSGNGEHEDATMVGWLYLWTAAANLICGSNHMHEVVIIGSGCAGLTAAIYAGRANLKPLVIDGHEPGGQLSLTTHVENFPGFPDGIMGPELIENMRKQAAKFGTEFKSGVITDVDVSQRPFKIVAGKDTYEAKALIVAAGGAGWAVGAPHQTA